MSPGGPYELKMEGRGNVRRFFSAFPKEAAEDTPAIRRKAPRNVSLMFIRFSVAPAFHRPKVYLCGDSRPSAVRRAQLTSSFAPLGSTKKPRRGGALVHTDNLPSQWSEHEGKAS